MYVVKVGSFYLQYDVSTVEPRDSAWAVSLSPHQKDALRFESADNAKIAHLQPGARFVKLRPKA